MAHPDLEDTFQALKITEQPDLRMSTVLKQEAEIISMANQLELGSTQMSPKIGEAHHGQFEMVTSVHGMLMSTNVIKVYYCGECSMPIEYCEYSGKVDKCRQWLEKNLPELVDELQLDNGNSGQDGKKHQKRGGKGTSKTDKPSAEKEKVVKSKITIQRAPRSKTKSVTVIKGLGTFGIDLKVASKVFASKFACGSSVTGADEIVIQGDCKDDLFSVIPEKWKQVDKELIEDLGYQKR